MNLDGTTTDHEFNEKTVLPACDIQEVRFFIAENQDSKETALAILLIVDNKHHWAPLDPESAVLVMKSLLEGIMRLGPTYAVPVFNAARTMTGEYITNQENQKNKTNGAKQ